MADYILAMGGVSGDGSPYNTVDVFRVTENGVEAVTGHGLALSAARYNLAAASCGNYILAMGGVSGDSSSSNTVDVFRVTESGVEKVTGHGLSLSAARYGLVAVSCGSYILAMGGTSSGSLSNTVDVFKVTENGVEAVTGHGLTLSTGRYNLAAVSCGNYILAMGGYSSNSRTNTVDVFKVTESGVEAVTGHGLTLSTGRYNLAAVSCGSYILAMGGVSGDISLSNTVDVFRVTESGVEKVTGHGLSLSKARYVLAAASCGNYILAMGGASGSPYNTVDVFRVTASGVEKVTGHGLTLSEARNWLAAASCGNYILAMGGYSDSSSSNTVDVFKVTENGVEAATGYGLTLSEGRAGLAAASCGNYILAMGGEDVTEYPDAVDVFQVFD